MLLNNLYKPLQNYETKKFLSHLRPLFATLRQTYNALITNHLYFATNNRVTSTRSLWPFYRVKAALLPCQSYALIVQKQCFERLKVYLLPSQSCDFAVETLPFVKITARFWPFILLD